MARPLTQFERKEMALTLARMYHLWKAFGVSLETIRERMPEELERIRSGVQERWDMSMKITIPEHIYTLIRGAPSRD
jgi:hypothetical protein